MERHGKAGHGKARHGYFGYEGERKKMMGYDENGDWKPDKEDEEGAKQEDEDEW